MPPGIENRIKRILGVVGLQPYRRFPFFRTKRFNYRSPRRLFNTLPSELSAPVALPAPDSAELETVSELYKIWKRIPGAHKWPHYFETYDAIAAQLDKQPIRMLEIGVYKGGSLQMWREFLRPEAIIVGIDIDPDCKAFDRPQDNLFVRIGDQSDPEFLDSIVEEFGPFDFILDDGSHICSHMIDSFNALFMDGLKQGGIYLLEDTHSSFWPDYRDSRYTFIDYAKDLVDLMHAHYWDYDDEKNFRYGHESRTQEVLAPRISAWISEIQFRDSLVTIKKSRNPTLPVSVHL